MRTTSYFKIIGEDTINAIERQFTDTSRAYHPIGMHILIIAGKNGALWVFQSQFELSLQISGLPSIIRIQESNEIKSGFLNPPITGSRYARIFLMNDTDTPILHRLGSSNTAVCRAIIHHHNLKILKALLQDRAQRLSNLAFLIVQRYHNTYHTNNPFFFALSNPSIIP